jgi:hypothetical protein
MKQTHTFSKPVAVSCNGTSIWGDTSNVTLKVKSVTFEYCDDGFGGYVNLWVNHNSRKWWVYTDAGFEKGVSKLVSGIIGRPVKVSFTEQGMQAERRASMSSNGAGDKKIMRWFNMLRGVK